MFADKNDFEFAKEVITRTDRQEKVLDQLPRWTHKDAFESAHELTWQENGKVYYPEEWKLLQNLIKTGRKIPLTTVAEDSAKESATAVEDAKETAEKLKN